MKKMIKLYVVDKQFGKNFINYKALNTENNEIIKEGKCKEYEMISDIYFGLKKEYGDENVRMLSR